VGPVDHQHHFDTELLRQGLRQRAVFGGVATAAGYAGRVALMVGSTMVLSRLLRPADFGLVAMVTSITGFSNMFLDFGLSTATIQREDVRHDQVTTMFWINLAISLFIGLVIAALAPAIVWFYGEPRLLGITLALAVAALLAGLSVQHQAILRRQMRYGALVGRDLAATACSAGVAVLLAWRGAGYWSLVAQQVVLVAVRTVLVWVASRWRPGPLAPLSEVRSMLFFGSHVTVARMLNTLTRNLDKVLIGRLWSAQLLGFYSRASNAIVVPFQQAGQALAGVAVPTLSRLQNDPARYRVYFRTAVTLMAALGLPVIVFLSVDAKLLVPLLLGDQWYGTVPFVPVLAPVAVLEMITTATRWVFLSLGHGAKLLRWRLFESVIKVLGLLVGLAWGAVGLAAGLAVTSTALLLPALFYGLRDSPLRSADVTRSMWRPALAAGLGGAAVLALRWLGFESWPLHVALAVDAAVFAALYLGGWLILPRGKATLFELVRLAREFQPLQRSGRSAQKLRRTPP
jgi:O-antigen/teichoic acid export membrane protein